jgi:2-succinyl-5-enolpyruvyl-6-hydroxy-3-cyclohexene-1-carboxylate synthase
VEAPSLGAPPRELVARIAREVEGKRGVVYCGPEASGLPAFAVTDLAERLGWPVLAEPLSGTRAGTHSLTGVIDAYDPLFRTTRFPVLGAPEVVLRFGAAPTSRPAMGFLTPRDGLREYAVDVAGGWRDPDGTTTTMIHAEPALFASLLMGEVRVTTDGSWLSLWRDANAAARRAIEEAASAMDEPFEGRVPVELAEALRDGSTLVVGNSMPVRDTESFFPAIERDVRIVGTRGASGIDGVVSTAVGAAAAKDGPVVLLIGDLSFFHDLNGLWPLRRHGLSLTVVLVNNDGGGIFNFLAQAEAAPEHFEQWFGTPHGLDFSHAVALHGGRYERLEGAGGWAPRIRQALASEGLTVLEVRTDRVRNVAQHREVWAHVEAAVNAALEVPDDPDADGRTRPSLATRSPIPVVPAHPEPVEGRRQVPRS